MNKIYMFLKVLWFRHCRHLSFNELKWAMKWWCIKSGDKRYIYTTGDAASGRFCSIQATSRNNGCPSMQRTYLILAWRINHHQCAWTEGTKRLRCNSKWHTFHVIWHYKCSTPLESKEKDQLLEVEADKSLDFRPTTSKTVRSAGGQWIRVSNTPSKN